MCRPQRQQRAAQLERLHGARQRRHHPQHVVCSTARQGSLHAGDGTTAHTRGCNERCCHLDS
jgi:hypothetical protein